MKIMEEAVSCSMFKNLLHVKLIYLKYFSTLHFSSLKSQMQALHFIEPSIFTAMYCTALHCTSLHSTVSSFMQQDVQQTPLAKVLKFTQAAGLFSIPFNILGLNRQFLQLVCTFYCYGFLTLQIIARASNVCIRDRYN